MAILSRLALKNVEEHDHLENVLISQAGARSAASGCGLGPLLDPEGLCWRSWAAPGAYVASLGPCVRGLGPLLGPMFAILGPPFESIGGLESLLGPLLTVLGHLGPRSVKNPSGKAIWQADQGRKVAQT